MKKLLVSVAVLSLLQGCGSESSNNELPEISKGTLSIGISDSPMHSMQKVQLEFYRFHYTDANGIEHQHQMSDVQMNLMDYRGMDRHMVIDQLNLPAGQYHNGYFEMVEGDGNQGCYVDNGTGRHGLHLENGRIHLGDFEVKAGGHQRMTIEMDLYRGLHGSDQHHQGYHFHQDASYSVADNHMGHLIGEVDPQWVEDCETKNAANGAVDGNFGHMAYLYPAEVNTIEAMADISGKRDDGRIAPIATAPLFQDHNDDWHFHMGFLPKGEYRVGYTCLAHLDDASVDDIATGRFEMEQDAGSVVVNTGENGGHQNVMTCGNGHRGGGHGGHGG
ncbi:DUF4382 domain-containing protein [Paraferrimonas sedimenticola]|uniref:DUF4382 domain-containing protein n=1 Tax=Paraferrimonas sedimenticola TaxID=375674 RepID=A0AA37VWU2_9GAMM|nr:DUF4382 domain-containing protein [Paraferrimonas sedimenticola]GLP96521.1 hypothetical protein GCM10007895_18270 [Paraferrimonas sedimenticola]